jgi:signal transduction histidine kinase
MQEKTYSIIQPILIVTGIFILVAGFLVSYILYFSKRKQKYLKDKMEMQKLFENELLKTQLEAQEQTLNKVGEELHDNICQLLSSTKLLLGLTERKLTTIPDSLKIASETLSKAIHEIRAVSKSMNKEWLHQFNLVENLNLEVERIRQSQAIAMTLNYNEKFISVDVNSQLMLFRVIQEAIQNSLKHANGETVVIDIDSQPDKIVIKVIDDGKGIDFLQNEPSGVGMLNMKKRVSIIGGQIEFLKSEPSGTEIRMTIPVQSN